MGLVHSDTPYNQWQACRHPSVSNPNNSSCTYMGKAQDFEGSDISRTTYTGQTDVEKDTSCCAKCVAEPACEYWVRATNTQDCWLKNGFIRFVPNNYRRGNFINLTARANVTLTIDARFVTHELNPLILGCHSDSGFGHQTRGLSAEMIFSQSFEMGDPTKPLDPTKNPDGIGWVSIIDQSAKATIKYDTVDVFGPAPASISITYSSGIGRVGIANRGFGNEGLFIEGNGHSYHGYFFVKADSPLVNITFDVLLEDYTKKIVLARHSVKLFKDNSNSSHSSTHNYNSIIANWTRLNFTLTPNTGTKCVGITPFTDPTVTCPGGTYKGGGPLSNKSSHICVKCNGQLVISLGKSVPEMGSIRIGYVSLQPGEWGRFNGLPVRKDSAETLLRMGVTMFRAGGSFAQNDRYFWKDWIGTSKPWTRKPFRWRHSLVSGWGPFEIMQLGEKLGIDVILTTAACSSSMTADDFGDLVEYCYGDPDKSKWGHIRAVEDNHPEPYHLKYIELGNEQQNINFVEQVLTMEARARSMGLPNQTITYFYPWGGGGAGTGGPKDPKERQAAAMAIQNGTGAKIAADLHVYATGGLEANMKLLADASLGGNGWDDANLETNCGEHTHGRGLSEAQDLIRFMMDKTAGKNGRLLGRAGSFCMERSGFNEGGWNDQGLIFFLPNMTWIQPPGYVHMMVSEAWQPYTLKTKTSGCATVPVCRTGGGVYDPAPCTFGSVHVSAATVIHNEEFTQIRNMTAFFVNMGGEPVDLTLNTIGAKLSSTAILTEMSGYRYDAANTPSVPTAILPVQRFITFGQDPLKIQARSFVSIECQLLFTS